MNESSETAKLVKELRKHGWFFKHTATEMGARGIPDVLGCIRGRFVGIEVKVKKGNLLAYTRHQQIKLDEIREAGGLAIGVAVDIKRPPANRWALDTGYSGQTNKLTFISLPGLVEGITELVG